MCAISGILDLDMDAAILKRMQDTMHRRGPDGQGIYRDPKCCLIHSRLAIIDPQGGKQPMFFSWKNEDYVFVYNGELYNTQELRSELKAKGHTFSTHSDTEVILHAYAEYGPKCLEKLNGIFAFAVWEQRRKRLFLARDRIGVKPLFYTLRKDGLLFASEIKTLLAHPAVRPQLDASGAAQLILLGPGRFPGSGIFRDIQALEPGCCGWYEDGKLLIHRYWKLTDREHTDSFPDTVEKVRYLVTDAIRRQMVSDVGIGAFLSGGLDSSIISAVCAEELRLTGDRLKTFSVDYRDNDLHFRANKFQPESDNAYIRLMRDSLDAEHHWTVLSTEDLTANLEAATIARDLPGMADVDFSLLAFCKEIRKEVKVALSGECADEIFGGYPWYRDPEIRAMEGFPWAQNTIQRGQLMNPILRDILDPAEFVMDAYQDTCRESDILPGTGVEERQLKQMVNLNFRWFMQTLLDRKDRMSMYHSLEVRVPFCDYRIAEYLYGVPWKYKDYMGMEKGLLRKAVEGLLPDAVCYRKKSPYPKTFDPAYEQWAINQLKVLLADRNAPVFSLLHREKTQSIIEMESRWPWYGQLMRRPQLMAYILQMNFWLTHYKVDILF